jgi:hypothetical protein
MKSVVEVKIGLQKVLSDWHNVPYDALEEAVAIAMS